MVFRFKLRGNIALANHAINWLSARRSPNLPNLKAMESIDGSTG
jgi:hypothetical protein